MSRNGRFSEAPKRKLSKRGPRSPESGAPATLHYTMLYYTILYYAIPYYTILYYNMICYTMIYYTILNYTILYDTILYDTIRSSPAERPARAQSSQGLHPMFPDSSRLNLSGKLPMGLRIPPRLTSTISLRERIFA